MKLGFNSPVPLPRPVEKTLNQAKKDDDVMAVAVFGSYARSESSGISDLDICIFLRPRKYNATQLHKKRMSYLEAAASDRADVQIFQQLPLPVRSRILKEEKMMLVKDEDSLYDLAFETVKDFEAFRKHYDEYLAGVADAGPTA